MATRLSSIIDQYVTEDEDLAGSDVTALLWRAIRPPHHESKRLFVCVLLKVHQVETGENLISLRYRFAASVALKRTWAKDWPRKRESLGGSKSIKISPIHLKNETTWLNGVDSHWSGCIACSCIVCSWHPGDRLLSCHHWRNCCVCLQPCYQLAWRQGSATWYFRL